MVFTHVNRLYTSHVARIAPGGSRHTRHPTPTTHLGPRVTMMRPQTARHTQPSAYYTTETPTPGGTAHRRHARSRLHRLHSSLRCASPCGGALAATHAATAWHTSRLTKRSPTRRGSRCRTWSRTSRRARWASHSGGRTWRLETPAAPWRPQEESRSFAPSAARPPSLA